MAYILDERLFPQPCDCGTCAPAHTGWECPRCHRVWNPSVLACHHCPEPPAFTAKGDAG